ncbi:MAG: hypothetical protein PHY08_12955 [Candidatus Cloacimonetes bacterium]|nr:hypothetical protein [Candidatus Cloacimonadota bacterium]
MEKILSTINEFKNESLRHKICIILISDNLFFDLAECLKDKGFELFDIGLSLSQHLKDKIDSKYISDEATEFVNSMLCSGASPLFIHNLGILLESEININAVKILKNASRNRPIFIIWKNNIDSNILSWNTQKNKYYLNFSDTTIKRINYEV